MRQPETIRHENVSVTITNWEWCTDVEVTLEDGTVILYEVRPDRDGVIELTITA